MTSKNAQRERLTTRDGSNSIQAERQELPTAKGSQQSRVLQVLDREQSPCVQPSMQSTTTTAPSTKRCSDHRGKLLMRTWYMLSETILFMTAPNSEYWKLAWNGTSDSKKSWWLGCILEEIHRTSESWSHMSCEDATEDRTTWTSQGKGLGFQTRVFKTHHPTSNCRIRCNARPLHSKQRHIKGSTPNRSTQVTSIPWKPKTTEDAQLPCPTVQGHGLRTGIERPRVSQSQQISDPFHARLKRVHKHRSLELTNAQSSKHRGS